VVTAVVLDVVGSGAVLILLALTWQRVRIARQAPFADVAADLSGRTVAPAVFGLALVTLAGAVAALATRGTARRVVGVVVVAAGLATVVAAATATAATGGSRARTLAAQALADRAGTSTVVPVTDGTVSVVVHAVWPVLAAVAGVLAVVAGVLWTLPVRGAGPRTEGGLGARYEAPVAAERPRDASLWSALDHGEDPTAADAEASVDPGPTPVEHNSDTSERRG
jgi:uncharacterized membrane protein (TIGR02234 family)